MHSTPQYIELGYRLNRVTAGTGGIQHIRSRKMVDGSKQIQITGVLLPPIPRAQAPNYNKRLPSGSMLGLVQYEIAHLWGPGFGDEAWDGMMYAPRAVNQEWQNRGIEKWLRDLRVSAARESATVELVATATSHITTWKGSDLLRAVSYVFEMQYPSVRRQFVGRVELEVGLPDNQRVSYSGHLLPI